MEYNQTMIKSQNLGLLVFKAQHLFKIKGLQLSKQKSLQLGPQSGVWDINLYLQSTDH